MHGARLFCVSLALGLAAAGAGADDPPAEGSEEVARGAIIEETRMGDATTETAAADWPYPKAYASRPLTMNKYMIRGTFSVGVKRAIVNRSSTTQADKPLISIDMGAAFSPLEKLEVGVSNYRVASTPAVTGRGIFPVLVQPTGGFGDMPLYVRYSFLHKDYVEMAADFVFLIPTWTNLSATFGLPVRIRVRDSVSIDTGTELTILANGVGLNVEVPIKATYSIRPAGFLFADSGFSFQNIARNVKSGSYYDSSLAFPVARNQVFVPLGAGGGYTHVIKDIVMLDTFARFGWNPLAYLNAPSGVDKVPVRDSWMLTVGVIIHTSPILHEGEPE